MTDADDPIPGLLAAVERYGKVVRQLRDAGIEPDPNAIMIPYERPAAGVPVVVVGVDRAMDVPDPGYCVHGYASCVQCDELTILGDGSFDAVANRGVFPLCMVCVRAGSLNGPIGRVHDTWRGIPPT